MSEESAAQEPEFTYEGIVDNILAMLQRAGALPPRPWPTPWDAFLRLSDIIHTAYEVPSTTFTPIMRRLLFAIGFRARPRVVVGVGTYVGYTFSWLLRDRADCESAPFCESAFGIDIDASANVLARRNCAAIGHGGRLEFLDGDGVALIPRLEGPIDLLYIDLDDPATGKAGYRRALEVASPLLRPGGLVLAHDACVRKFAPDFDAYHGYVRESGLFSGTWVLPVDHCGLSVAAVRPGRRGRATGR